MCVAVCVAMCVAVCVGVHVAACVAVCVALRVAVCVAMRVATACVAVCVATACVAVRVATACVEVLRRGGRGGGRGERGGGGRERGARGVGGELEDATPSKLLAAIWSNQPDQVQEKLLMGCDPTKLVQTRAAEGEDSQKMYDFSRCNCSYECSS